ncbi:MAG: PIN domain-containing protein [Moraxella sp.]|nr:PIN domain-containing protein [Moraxella sp.]
MKKILLLDIENIAVKADEIFAFCKKYDRVYIGFAKSPAIFALQDIAPLTKLLHKKLFLIEMKPNKKSDGADFGLAFYAGMLSQEFKPTKVKFHIMSSDRDFEHIAKLLTNKGFGVKQIGQDAYRLDKSMNDGTMPSLEKFRENIYLHDIKSLCDEWFKTWNKPNRPAKVKTLKSVIYQKLRLTDESIDVIFELLKQYKIISVKTTKITYHHQYVKNWTMLRVDGHTPKKSQLKSRQEELSIPPKTEHIIASFELKRLKNICELLFVMAESKPRDLPSFKEWLGDELAITNEFSVQNVVDTMTEYRLIKQVNGRLVFHDTAIERWANVQLNSAHDNFVRIDGRLMTKGNVAELKDRLVQFVQSEQKKWTGG